MDAFTDYYGDWRMAPLLRQPRPGGADTEWRARPVQDPAVRRALDVWSDPGATRAQREWAARVLLDAGVPGVWRGGLPAEAAEAPRLLPAGEPTSLAGQPERLLAAGGSSYRDGGETGSTAERIARAIWGHPNARAADVTLEGFVERAFGGDWELYDRFITRLAAGLPEQTSVMARGSAVTGYKWLNGQPFDALGPGTSDIDLVLIGNKVMKYWLPSEFKIPGMYTANLGDATPYVAPELNPLRLELQNMVGRPVNIQAASQAYVNIRQLVQRHRYLLLIKK